jgi:lipoprotein NlpD
MLAVGCGMWITVHDGDTLYSIAKENGVTINDVLDANPSVKDPNTIHTGQKLKIPRSGRSISDSAAKDSKTATSNKANDRSSQKSSKDKIKQRDLAPPSTQKQTKTPDKDKDAKAQFIWPVSGTIISHYGKGPDGQLNEGIDIAAPAGTKIVAAADGEVALTHTADDNNEKLKAWGNIIVIRHANKYMTVYVHNRVNLVKKGDKVKQGQVIAEVGDTGRAKQPMLHFLIRYNKETVDPLSHLPK